ncbi:hypothetical protein AYY17_01490 [Morganella psychrotolerans]|uniref:Uncharacterized protein n=2 Tax=Morganella psychrotolerans TaxID=368603 RepID=A0A1B8HQE7_9GAMM|nr:hypothetical protein AYY17_01490 [Morganella psychrotolerans]
MRKFIISGIMAVLLSGCAGSGSNTPDAPYGFKWGQTPEELSELNLNELDCTETSDGGKLCSSLESPDIKKQFFMTVFSPEGKGLNGISRFGLWSRDQTVLLSEYDKINAEMEAQYGQPEGINEEYDRNTPFLEKIAKGKIGQFKRKYEKEGVEIVVGIVSNANLVRIIDENDLTYTVLTMYTLK